MSCLGDRKNGVLAIAERNLAGLVQQQQYKDSIAALEEELRE
jgi:hypothetical protein